MEPEFNGSKASWPDVILLIVCVAALAGRVVDDTESTSNRDVDKRKYDSDDGVLEEICTSRCCWLLNL
jgi:hypothetical protein